MAAAAADQRLQSPAPTFSLSLRHVVRQAGAVPSSDLLEQGDETLFLVGRQCGGPIGAATE